MPPFGYDVSDWYLFVDCGATQVGGYGGVCPGIRPQIASHKVMIHKRTNSLWCDKCHTSTISFVCGVRNRHKLC